MTSPAPDAMPADSAEKVTEFAALLSTGQVVAASTAMLEWCDDEAEITRYFATVATTLLATRVRVDTDRHVDRLWVLRHTANLHDRAMCQVVVRIVNGEPDVALDLLNAHRFVHGTTGLFWVGVFAVRMLADLLTNNEKRMS